MSTVAVNSSAALSPDRRLRYTLTRKWDRGLGSVCWIMLNPSTADEVKDDPTIRRITRFSMFWGYAALTVVNLYPFRSSKPRECRDWAAWDRNGPDWYARDALHRNADIVARQARSADLVVAAWGDARWAWDWMQYMVTEHLTAGVLPLPRLYCLGETANGSPKHPLARGAHWVPVNKQPELWPAWGLQR